MKNRTTEDKPTLVPARAMQWLEPGRAIDLARTESLADLLVRGTERPHLTETPLTGKPDALCGQLGYVVPSGKGVDSLGFSYSPHHIIFSK